MRPATLERPAAEQPAETRDQWLTRMLECVERELSEDAWLRESPLLNRELVEFGEYLELCKTAAQ